MTNSGAKKCPRAKSPENGSELSSRGFEQAFGPETPHRVFVLASALPAAARGWL